jgi:hypothetical protein
MPTVTLHIDDSGHLEGLSERDRKAYAKFRTRLATLGDSSITFSWTEPRSGPYHRRFFALLNRLLDCQEQFQEIEHLLSWLKVGAGYADLVPGPKGKPVALPRSINFVTLDQAEFEPIAQAMISFMRTTYASRFLWPHLDDLRGAGMVDTVLAEFGE